MIRKKTNTQIDYRKVWECVHLLRHNKHDSFNTKDFLLDFC